MLRSNSTDKFDGTNDSSKRNRRRSSFPNASFMSGNLVESYFRTTKCVYDLGKETKMSPGAEAAVRTANRLKQEAKQTGVIKSEVVGDKIVLKETGIALQIPHHDGSVHSHQKIITHKNETEYSVSEKDSLSKSGAAKATSTKVTSTTTDTVQRTGRTKQIQQIHAMRDTGIFSSTDIYSQADDMFSLTRSRRSAYNWDESRASPHVTDEVDADDDLLPDLTMESYTTSGNMHCDNGPDDTNSEPCQPPPLTKSASHLGITPKTPPKSILRNSSKPGLHTALPRRHTHVHFTGN